MTDKRVAFQSEYGEEYYENDIMMLLESNKPKDKIKLNKIIIEMVEDDNIGALRYLLNKGYKIEEVYSSGETFFHLAFYNSSNDILTFSKHWIPYITEDVANIACSDDGLTILHIACSLSRSQKLVEKCLACKANVNAVWLSDASKMERDGFTPLHFAAVNFEGANFTKLLIDHNANVNAKDSRGRTPLHLACSTFEDPDHEIHGVYANFAEIILENNAQVNAKDNHGNTPLHSLFLNCYDTFTFIERSISKAPVEEIKMKMKILLEDNGIDITARNNNGDTILHLIVASFSWLRGSNRFAKPSYDFDDSCHVELIRQIFAACPDFNVNVRNHRNETPFALAMSYLSVDIVRILLDYDTEGFGDYFFFQNQKHFHYLNIVPRLEEVVNYIGIIELIEANYAVTIDPHDKFDIMWHLVHNNHNDCNCGYFKIKNNGSMVCNLLELVNFGSSLHLEHVYNNLTDVHSRASHYEPQMSNLIIENLKIRKYANIYIDSTLPSIFLLGERLSDPVSQEDTLAQLDKELEKMKSQKLRDNVMLYDVMVKHPHNIYQYLTDANFISIARDYSLYKDIIKGHLTKSVVRNYVEKTAFDSLQHLLPPFFPSLCCKLIMDYLSNKDILNVFNSVMDEL